MKYISTRSLLETTAAGAIARGLAPDGGLYVPASVPKLTEDDLRALCAMNYRERAVKIMGLFLEEFSAEELERFAAAAYGAQFDDARVAPVHALNENTSFLELWHGPTCAFKDMALQMLPHLLTASLKKTGEQREVCILVATSGDTGKAALEGFRDVPGIHVFVYYPKDGVSEVQRAQMVTQRGGNVRVAAVRGNFDDAQTAVKRALGDGALAARLEGRGVRLSSANSINFGRLLPQIVYYARTALRLSGGEPVRFVVPSGNFGNILAGYLAKRMGAPVGELVCASNENRVLADFLATGVYDVRRPFHKTISPSMDILVSSNLERLLFLATDGNAERVRAWMRDLRERGVYAVDSETLARIRADFGAGSCDGEGTRRAMAACWRENGYLLDPHTAVGFAVLRELAPKGPTVLVSTASPFKFAQDVLPAVGAPRADGFAALDALSRATGLPVPTPLAELPGLPVRFREEVASGEIEKAWADLLPGLG